MRSSGQIGFLPVFALILAGLMSFAPGCSSDGNGGKGGAGGQGGTQIPDIPCTSNDECPASDRCDLELEICVPRCTADNQCPRDTGTYCDLESGECIPGEPCDGDVTCGTDRRFDYCKDIGDCVCAPDRSVEESDQPGNGVCWRVAGACEPCSNDFECGASGVFGTQRAECKLFPYGSDRIGVCLPKLTNRCPPGMLQMDTNQFPELAEYCMPQGGNCASMIVCSSDDDCTQPGLPVCDPIRQICIPGCTFDYDDRVSVGCAPGRVCHATAAGTDPTLLNSCETAPAFGIGTCDVPCSTNDDCSRFDPSFVCMADVEGGPKRCRPEGCMDDRECEFRGGVAAYNGYCDVNTNECVYDQCRVGIDPRQGCGSDRHYPDCIATHKCEQGDEIGFGSCVKKNCIENGGAFLGCLLGNFCAGEPYVDMMTGEVIDKVVEGPEDTPIGECFPMDLSVWCEQSCSSHGDCVGKGPVNIPQSPSLCGNNGHCIHGCEYNEQCPSGWYCSSQGLEIPCDGYQVCEQDSECGPGNRCVTPKIRTADAFFPEGLAPFKVCECSGTDSCGGGYTCGAGVATASQDPTSPQYGKVAERYCARNDACGSGGSCEWWGNYAQTFSGDVVPLFSCTAWPDSFEGPKAPTCPDGSRQGETAVDVFHCVVSQVCQPAYMPDPETGDPICGVALPPDE